MNKLLNAVFAVVLGLLLGVAESEAAKRFGGGRSVGTQRESVQQQQSAPAKPAQQQQQQQAAPGAAQAAPAAATGASRWLGPVAGLLAGGLLGALLFGGAFDGFKFMDFAMILLLAAAVFFIFRMLRKPNAAQQEQRAEPMRYAGVGTEPRIEPSAGGQPYAGGAAMPAAASLAAGNYYPAGFDPEAFAAQAKQNFVRLQDANDRGDLTQLRDVMTPALYKEIEAQFHGRAGATQKTEVVTLDAKVVEVVTENANYVASVRFSGMIKEDGGQPEHFSEMWHLQKPTSGSSGWLLAGIQQD
jgi:predicted lipid-binding transport protein (Tim44 family)